MTRTLVRLLVVVSCLAVWPASAMASHPGPLYGADGPSGIGGNLYELDPETGAILRTIGPTGHALTGLAVDPRDCSLYGSTGRSDTASNPNPGHLIRINTSTGEGTVVGDLQDNTETASDITFTPDGTLYGFLEPGSDRLATIDTATGQATFVGGDPGLSTSGSGLASSGDGTIYFTGEGDSGRLLTLDRTTGEETAVADLNGTTGEEISALAFSQGGTLFGVLRLDNDPAEQQLLTIDTATGDVNVRGALPNAIEGIAFGCSPVHPAQAPQEQPTPVASDTVAPRVTVAGVRGSCVTRNFRLRVRINEPELALATVSLDGRRVAKSRRNAFSVVIRPSRLRAGRHRIRIAAVDEAGNRRTVRRSFTRCARRAQRPRFTG